MSSARSVSQPAEPHGAAASERKLSFSLPQGERVYAVGDVHGCAEAFEQLMQLIRRDVAMRERLNTRLVLLGDLIDRGPASAQVLRMAMRYQKASDRFVVLKGNHEQLMGEALEGDQEAMALWLAVGGAETLISFGLDPALVREGASDTLIDKARLAVGTALVDWLLHLPLSFKSGEIMFVHAGVRPGVPLERQDAKDLLWIREPFLSDTAARSALIVHGHSVFPQGPDWGEFRIGVDTGACLTGRLTALGLEASSGWALSTAA